METWKERLADRIDPRWAKEIDVYETQLDLKRQGKIDDKLFAETRLRRGAYGQRYDNGQRNDGTGTKLLPYPHRELTKGPDTLWDAPGMQRIKIPFGGLSTDQLDTLADLAEEYSDGILHITTRQDIQLHYIHIDDTPSLMRRLAAAGITTQEACGNVVRNVTACPIAGVCCDETFDVTPYARAMAFFLLGHPDLQNFGRKFKVAFSGCQQHACGIVNIHDLGFVARVRTIDGEEKRGFETYVGGGLGTVPYQARVFDEFVPEEEILPLMQAMGRVFARLGEKKNRARARMKFLVVKLGLDEFRRLVREERATLAAEDAWTSYLSELPAYGEKPLKPGAALAGEAGPEGFAEWRRFNVARQRQDGYVVTTVKLPLGDLSSWQARELADIARRFVGDTIRTTVEQNIVLRWVSEADLPQVYGELNRVGLAGAGAGTIVDITTCPGTDTCKLGIASSRGLTAELANRLATDDCHRDAVVNGLRIKISGCFNSCGQHHVADLGFYGVSRNIGGRTVPHFQVVLGGRWEENGGSYGLAVAAVPSKRIPDVVARISERYIGDREGDESFQSYIARIGKKALKEMLSDLTAVPAYTVDPSYYSDWGDPREFTLGDLGKGECAGEVVSLFDFDIQAAERLAFEAQVLLDDGDFTRADGEAYAAMVQAARALVRVQSLSAPDDTAELVAEFRRRLFEPKLFWNRFAGGKFAEYLLRRHDDADRAYTPERAHRLIEEAQLFIEEAHACYARMMQAQAEAGVPVSA